MSIDIKPIADAFREGLEACTRLESGRAEPSAYVAIGMQVMPAPRGVRLSFRLGDAAPRRFTFASETEAAAFVRRVFSFATDQADAS